MKFNVEKFVEGLHDYFRKELKPLVARLRALEKRATERGEKGEKGDAGERGEKGLDGKDGKDGVKGEKGDAGERGEKGLDGKDGKDGVKGEKGDAGERGEKGLDGKDGKDGVNGEKGDAGERGEKGLDGKSVSEEDIEKIVQSRVAVWALDFERRAQEVLQKAISSIAAPKDGADGKDGIGFDELSVVQLGEKKLKFIFQGDGRTKEFAVDLPIVVDAGVYKDGQAYSKGDGVTYGGSFWISQCDNPSQAPGKSSDWRLAVKRGRDAKDVRP